MRNSLKMRPKIRRKCRKCGAKLVNKPEYGAVCPDCGWYIISYTDGESIIHDVKASWNYRIREDNK